MSVQAERDLRPDEPGNVTDLSEVRAHIDRIDREIVRLLGERATYVREAARFKTGEASVRAPERLRRMISDRRSWAEAEALSPDFVEALFRAVTDHFIERELEHWHRAESGD
jgi:isochorismate pyruvate lyase